MLDLVLTYEEELVGKVMPQCSFYQVVKVEILMAMMRSCRKLVTLDLRRTNFDFFKGLLGEVSWEEALEGRGA